MTQVSIYGLFDETGIRYVGKTSKPLQKRLYNHLSPKPLSRKTHKANWLKKLLREGKKPEIRLLETVDESIWQDRERAWISFGRRIGWNLTNITDGGEGLTGLNVGRVRTPETLALISENSKRMWKDPAYRIRQIAKRKGKKHSPEHREKISNSMKGIKRTEEWKANLSELVKQRWAKQKEVGLNSKGLKAISMNG